MPLPEVEKPETIIQRDRKDHPECRYSSSISKACTTMDGNRSCETIRRILRSCPDTRPEQIYEDATRDGASSTPPGAPSVHNRQQVPDLPFRRPGMNGGFFTTPFEEVTGELFADMLKPFKGFFDESSMQFPPFHGPPASEPAPRPAQVPWRSRAGMTTPDCPAPHKGKQGNQERMQKWRNGSVVEQA